MTRIVTAPSAPAVSADETSVFLAGGITGCPDWQQEVCGLLGDIPKLVLLNPRRNEPTDDAAAQIFWEWRRLKKAHAISFWFAAETLQPISLFELGRWTADYVQKPIFVGVHDQYPRRIDIEIQLRCQCPWLEIADSIPSLTRQIKDWLSARASAP